MRSIKRSPNSQQGKKNGSSDQTVCISRYLLSFSDDLFVETVDGSQVIWADSIEEAILYLKLLGNFCTPAISGQYSSAHPGLYDKLIALSVPIEDKEAPLDINIAASLLKKIPFDLNNLVNSKLALKVGDPLPALIDKAYVHKNHLANILVSEPFSTGWIRYYNIFSNSSEFNFDHSSDHIQGMLILEALRQAGIASAHFQGLPLDGKLALLNFNTNFFNFLDPDSPMLCRSYCSFTADENSDDKEACIYIQVFQWGRICADTVLKAYACMHSYRCKHKENRLQKVSIRQKAIFESKINSIFHETSTKECK